MKKITPSLTKIKGTVIKTDLHGSATIEINSQKFVHKYERFLPVRTRIRAHNPPEIGAVIGDIVEANFCRPLSKTKHFMITKKIAKAAHFKLIQEKKEEAKVKSKKKVDQKRGENESS